ncbi:MAG: enoyl-CoA hydratase/isomerase family protein [Chloroflexi bacterium]|nr:enoyl-CoA hydratase/isomerase family protein [Chloroflexota bacterium]
MTTFETLILEKRDGFAYCTINRPDRANTLSRQLMADFNSALDEIEVDEDVRIVLVTGAGDRHFCGGADLRENASALGDRRPRSMGRDFMSRFEEIPQPVIAVINGAAMGGGCEIASACDFRFMAEEAKIGVPEILFGALPAGGGTQRLPRIVGMPKAKEMVLTGRHYTAQEALAMGLVTGIAPRAQVMAVAEAFAREIADLAPHSVRTGKMLVQRALDMELGTGLLFERRTILTMASPEEAKAAQEHAMAKSGTYKNIFSKA